MPKRRGGPGTPGEEVVGRSAVVVGRFWRSAKGVSSPFF